MFCSFLKWVWSFWFLPMSSSPILLQKGIFLSLQGLYCWGLHHPFKVLFEYCVLPKSVYTLWHWTEQASYSVICSNMLSLEKLFVTVTYKSKHLTTEHLTFWFIVVLSWKLSLDILLAMPISLGEIEGTIPSSSFTELTYLAIGTVGSNTLLAL